MISKVFAVIINKITRTVFIPSMSISCHINTCVKLQSYCTEKKVYFPLDYLPDPCLDKSKYDLGSWCKIKDEIKKNKESGRNLPSGLTMENIEELLRLESFSQRLKYLTFLFKKEMKKLSQAEKRLRKGKEKPLVKQFSDTFTNHIQYGLGKNTFMMGIRKNVIHRFYCKRLVNASLFGQKIVFDLGYDKYMRTRERKDCAAQLRLAYSNNRKHCDPYDIYFCNASPQSLCFQYLEKEMPTIDDSMISITENSYLDVFPKEKLIYLSPHASETLKEYDHRAVYIIGAFVDKVKREQVSTQKAEKDGIKSISLPIDEYILWGAGSKSLSVDQVFSIMMTFRDTGDWREAFKHIPTRKIRKVEPNSDEDKVASEKMFLLKKFN